MPLEAITQAVLALLESEGPAALGMLLEAIAPKLPIEALVALASAVEHLILARSEKAQMQAAVAAVENADAGVVGLVK